MFHKSRVWCLGAVGSPEELAEKLTSHSWTLCTGFYIAGFEVYLFLNDATHEDGAFEVGIVKRVPNGFIQVESVTFSWCQPSKALTCILMAIRGEFDSEGRPVNVSLQTPEEHKRCHLCA